jgi:two-component system, NarL family, nitrate/nitrite response regulator NarL
MRSADSALLAIGAEPTRAERRPRSVLVADDHSIVRAGMRLLLGGSRFFEQVGEARTGAETIERCRRLRPDVLLLDLRLPDLPAATVCSRVQARHPETAIVILTAFEEEAVIRGCIRVGARGCLFKDVTEQNLMAALMQVAHGRTVIDPRVAGAVLGQYPGGQYPGGQHPGGRHPGAAAGVSDREHDVLRELALGLTTCQIGTALDLSPNTVKSHLRRVFRKLGVRNRVQALRVARDRGLL